MSRAELAGILLWLSAVCCAGLAAAASMKKDLSRAHGNKSLELASALQADLRKNNDDYKELREREPAARNPYLGEAASAPAGTGLDFARRNLDGPQPQSKKPQDATPKTTKSADKLMLHDKGPKKDNKIIKTQSNFKTDDEKIKSDEKFLKSHRKNMPTNNKDSMLHDVKARKESLEFWKPRADHTKDNAMLHDKHIKKINNKMKLQATKAVDKRPDTAVRKKTLDWMQMNSEEVFDLDNKKTTKNPRKERRGFVTMTGTDARRNHAKYDELHRLLDKEGLLNKFLKRTPSTRAFRERGGERGVERPIGRAGGTRNRAYAFAIESGPETAVEAETIRSEELDMLPATGERIETLKRKGRFCFRHVLFPEGPKYDSQGRVYEPAHAQLGALKNRNFAHTRRPHLVLPKCCNCCKKSVLGCE